MPKLPDGSGPANPRRKRHRKPRDLKYGYVARIGWHQSLIQTYAEVERHGDPERVSPLAEISFAFCKNIDRIDAMVTLPMHASHTARIMQSAYSVACFRVTGDPDPEVQSKSVLRKIIREHNKIISEYRTKLLSTPELENARKVEFRNFSELLEAAPDTLRSGAEAVFDSHIIGTWIAFETLAGDLWEKALNVHPSILATLKGANKRISKAANTAYSKGRKETNQETDVERTITLSGLERATKGFTGNYGGMGTVLREEGQGQFASLYNIRASYSRAFSKDYDELDMVLKDTCFDALAVVRNVLVHKAGIVDKEYIDNSKGLAVPQGVFGEPIELDGEITFCLTRAVVDKCAELMKAVDAWLEEHGC